jgi:hypothetical protein
VQALAIFLSFVLMLTALMWDFATSMARSRHRPTPLVTIGYLCPATFEGISSKVLTSNYQSVRPFFEFRTQNHPT